MNIVTLASTFVSSSTTRKQIFTRWWIFGSVKGVWSNCIVNHAPLSYLVSLGFLGSFVSSNRCWRRHDLVVGWRFLLWWWHGCGGKGCSLLDLICSWWLLVSALGFAILFLGPLICISASLGFIFSLLGYCALIVQAYVSVFARTYVPVFARALCLFLAGVFCTSCTVDVWCIFRFI